MDSEREYSIEHVTHPNHPLSYFAGGSIDFQCDGCNQFGNGSGYRCTTCDFGLHDHCATCPTTFSFIVHPSHKLNLVFHADLHLQNHLCDVCGTQINGLMFYRCEQCNFDVHPLCTQLPEHTRHPLHPDHLLRLQPLPLGSCKVCKTTCATSWGYGCQVCDFNIHLPCVINSPLPNRSSFLAILTNPMTIFQVLILAIFVILIVRINDQRTWTGYSIHSVYYYLPNRSSFLAILMNPMTIFLVLILAIFIILIVRINDQ